MLTTDIGALGPRLLDLLPQIVWTARPDGGLDYYNQRWFDYTGMTLEQTRDWGWKPVLHPDDLDRCVERWTTAIANGSEYEVEYRFKRASDGAYRWHLGRAQPVRDEQQRIVKWFGTCTDIHDQKQVQATIEHSRSELDQRVRVRTADLATANDLMQRSLDEKGLALLALTASEQRFSSVVGSSRAGIFTCDERGIIVTWNPAAERMFGYSTRDALGLSSGDLMPERFRGGHRLDLDRIAASTPAAPMEHPPVIKGLRKDGSEFPLELSLASWFEGTRRVFSGIMQDVTDRQRDEAELRSHEEFKRRILESSSDCIKVLDLEGKLRSINGPGRILLEMDPEVDLIGAVWVSFWKGEAAELAQQAVASAIAGKPGHFSGFCPTCKGSPKWWDVAVTPILGKSGTPELLLVSSRDISDLKKTHDELESSRLIAEAATQAKGEFLANMSHEIRTPMNGVIGLTSLLIDTKLTGEQREYLNAVRLSGDALLTLINDILDFSKIEAGKLTVEPITFDLRTAVEDVIELLGAKAAEKGVDLLLDYPAALSSHLVGDEGRIRQILINLVGNALKFTAQGAVVVTVEEIDRTGTEARMRLAINDSGIGMTKEQLGRLFQPFSQADASTSRRFGGSGLGLAICARLSELMNGRITASSTPGKGSRFVVEIPLSIAATTTDTPPDGHQAVLCRQQVLIISDRQPSGAILASTLKSWGLEIAETNGTAADTATILANTVDPMLVLIDQRTTASANAVLAGLSLGANHIPILLVANGARSDADGAAQAGFRAYLSRPFRMGMLRQALASARTNHGSTRALVTRDSISNDTAPESSHPVINEAHRWRVLLAEDNAINQLLARRMLERMGYIVDVACNGAEAVDVAARAHYDLILMDCQMPEMDGFAATIAIRAGNGPCKAAPIIALTANAMHGDREACLQAGMDDHLPKPFTLNALISIAQLWMVPRPSANMELSTTTTLK